MKKPDAITVIESENLRKRYILDVGDMIGIGRATKKN